MSSVVRRRGDGISGRGITEFIVEEAALAWLESLGWQIAHDPSIASGELRVKDAEKMVEGAK